MHQLILATLLLAFPFCIASDTSELQGKNFSLSLNDLRHVFDAPNCSDAGMVCKTLSPREVALYLEKEVYSGVEKLCLTIKPSTVWGDRTIILTPLTHLTYLKWLWIQSQPLLNGTFSRLYEVKLHFPNMTNHALPLIGLFINVQLYGTESIPQFIENLHTLQLLSFAHTRNINKHNLLPDIIQSTEGKPLKAFSLQGFQNLANYRDKFILQLNITQLLWPMRNCPLEYLDLSYNNLLGIYPGIFGVTKQLRILDMSHNNLVSADNKGMLIELLFHPKLEVLHFNNQGSSEEFGHRVKRETGQPDKPHESFVTLLRQCMRKLGITILDIKEKTVFCELLYCIDWRFLHNIPCEALPSYQDIQIDFTCTYDIRVPIAKNLRELYADQLHIPATGQLEVASQKFCFGQNQLEKVTLSKNSLVVKNLYIDEDLKYRSIEGLERLTYMDLSDNALQIPLYNHMLQSLTSLKFLYLDGNYITLNSSDICHGNKLLEVVNLSNNIILELPVEFVENCVNLKSLDVSQNSLTDVYTQLSTENKLQLFNASNNRIRSLSEKTIENMKKIGSKGPVTFDLSNNPWDCGCDSMEVLESMEFMKSGPKFNITFYQITEYKCYRQGTYHFLYSEDVDRLRDTCFPSNVKLIALTVVTTVSVIVLVILLLLCYRCRYRINTFYFHTCQRLHQSRSNTHSSDIVFDAFISYAAEDRFWVHNVLRTQLEEIYGFKLCLHYRDFPACGDIADVIVDYIKRSRSIVVILSEYSVCRPWCEFELKSAHAQHINHGKDLIIIKLGKIPRNGDMSDLVTDLINSKVYIEWPDTGIKPTKSENKKQEVFWTKVEKAIYGQDYCGCLRYCNPCYDRNNALTIPLLDDSQDTL